MIFFILLLLGLLTAQARITDNCFRFASSFAFAPCIQCEGEFYLNNGICLPCANPAQQLTPEIKLQCEMSLGFSYGTNRGLTPRYSSKDVFATDVIPPSLPNLTSTPSQPPVAPPESKPEKNTEAFTPDPNCTRYQPQQGEKKNGTLLCVECKSGFYLNQLTKKCVFQEKSPAPVEQDQQYYLRFCLIYSLGDHKCLQCSEGYKAGEKDGVCYDPKAPVNTSKPSNSKKEEENANQTVEEKTPNENQKQYEVVVKQQGIPITSEHLEVQVSDDVETLDVLPYNDLGLGDMVIDLTQKNNFLPKSPSNLEFSLQDDSENLQKPQDDEEGKNNTQNSIDSNLQDDEEGKNNTQNSIETKQILDQGNNKTEILKPEIKNKEVLNCVEYVLKSEQCSKCASSYLLNRLENSCLKTLVDRSKVSYNYGFWFYRDYDRTSKAPAVSLSQLFNSIKEENRENCSKYDPIKKQCLTCAETFYLNKEGSCLSKEEYRIFLANYGYPRL